MRGEAWGTSLSSARLIVEGRLLFPETLPRVVEGRVGWIVSSRSSILEENRAGLNRHRRE